MPVTRDAEHLGGQVTDVVGECALADSCADHAAPLHLVEESFSLGLRVEEAVDACAVVELGR